MKRYNKQISIIVLTAFLLSIMNIPVFAEQLESVMEPMEIAEGTQEENTTTSAVQIRTMEDEISTVATEVASGACGDNLTWTIEDGTLTISGTGEMWYYGEEYVGGYGYITNAPWKEYIDTELSLVLEEGITKIGELHLKI